MMDFGFHPISKDEQLGRRNKVETPLRERNKKKMLTKEQVRTEVKKRDGDWCLLSGKPGPGLHLHRVIYSGMGGGSGKYEVWNCVLLSTEMHTLVHSNKRLWQPLLLEFLATKKAGRDPTKVLEKLRSKASR